MKARQFTPKFTATLGLALLFTFGCSKEDLNPSESLSASSNQEARATAAASPATLRSKHYIIIASGDKLPSNIESQTSSANGKVTAVISQIGVATATSDDPNFAAKASKISGVRSVVRDFTYQGFDPNTVRTIEADAANTNPPSSGDDDRFFPVQWGLTAIQAPAAWNAGARGKDVVVADLDSGFDLNHPDLKGNIIGSKSFVPTEGVQHKGTAFSHGTHTAGTIAALDNNIGVVGVAPEAKLLLVKVLRDSGSGAFSWMLEGIVYAADNNADVINLSLGASLPRNGKFLNDNGTPNDPSDDFIESDTKAVQELLVAIGKATHYAAQRGVTIIASAGNDANNGNKDQSLINIPAGSTNVVSISATAPLGWALNRSTDLDRMASYTNYGTSDVDFAAPGGDYMWPGEEIATIGTVRQFVWAMDMVVSTSANSVNPAGGYTWSAGTSMAAPHASGVAALIIGRNGGQMDPARVISALRASSDDLGKPGRDPFYGHGRVNAYRAVTQAN